MTVKDYILKRLNQGETNLEELTRQTRIQFRYCRVGFSYVRAIRNEWERERERASRPHNPAQSANFH